MKTRQMSQEVGTRIPLDRGCLLHHLLMAPVCQSMPKISTVVHTSIVSMTSSPVARTTFTTLSSEQRNWLQDQLANFQAVLPEFYLPSQHSLTRYLTAYVDCFNSHLPFIHVSCSKLGDFAPDTILAMCAIGAQYVFEHRNADRLFYAGKAVLAERMRQQQESQTWQSSTPQEVFTAAGLDHGRVRRLTGFSVTASEYCTTSSIYQSLSTAIILMGYSAWEGASLVQESLRMANVVVECLRDVSTKPFGPVANWRQWACVESQRRAQLVAFAFLGVLGIAYDVPPYMLNSQLNIRLPCTTAEWKAATECQWKEARKNVTSEQVEYLTALNMLSDTSKGLQPPSPMTAPFGNYVLLHGLIQKILLASEISEPTDDQIPTMSRNDFDQLELVALHYPPLYNMCEPG